MDFWNTQLVIYDKQLIKQIFVKDFQSFVDRGAPALLPHPFNLNLLEVKGQQWKRLRTIMTPTFTSGKLKQIFFRIVEYSNYCLDRVEDDCNDGKSMDLQKLAGKYSLGIIGTLAFGLDIRSNDREMTESLLSKLKEPAENIETTNPLPLIGFLFPFFISSYPDEKGDCKLPNVSAEIMEPVMQMVEQVYNHRKDGHTRNDMFQMLFEASTKDGDGMNKHELFSNVAVFLLAGFHTTMTSLSFSMYLLAQRPDLQEECAQEVERLLDGADELTYEMVHEMKLVELVMKETIRLFPPVRRHFRKCVSPTHLGGSPIEKGVTLIVPAHVINRLPEYWGDDAEEFNPKRFLNREGADDAEFQAFGYGQRRCIGERLALLEGKLFLARLLLKYRLVACDESKTLPNVDGFSWMTHPANTLKCNVTRRK